MQVWYVILFELGIDKVLLSDILCICKCIGCVQHHCSGIQNRWFRTSDSNQFHKVYYLSIIYLVGRYQEEPHRADKNFKLWTRGSQGGDSSEGGPGEAVPETGGGLQTGLLPSALSYCRFYS